jgi:hypothetical protein
LNEAGWVNIDRFDARNGGPNSTGRGIDDVLGGPDDTLTIAEYKGGPDSDLEGDQMEPTWVERKIDELQGDRNPLGNKLEAAWRAGKLRGVAIKTPAPGQTYVLKNWKYGVKTW